MLRFLGGSVLIALLTTVAISTALFEGVSTIADAFDKGKLITSKFLTPVQAGAPETILIIGSDKRYLSRDQVDRVNPPHSDTLILVRLDPRAGAVSVLSVPRDLLVPSFSYKGQTYTDQKINYAYTIGSEYGGTLGADNLALAVVKHALGDIQINDVIDLNFENFVTVVKKLGCVYVNVDHRFYHAPYIPGVSEPSDNYATIDINPGYQPLCSYRALDYVRYRHEDSTFARDARQQDFLRQAKAQLGVTGLLVHWQDIINSLGAPTSSIHGATATLRLVSLLVDSIAGPVRQIPFPNTEIAVQTAIGIQADQTATRAQLRAMTDSFLNTAPQARSLAPSLPRSAPHRGSHRHAAAPRHVTGLIATSPTTAAQALTMATSVPFPVLVPNLAYSASAQIEGSYDYYPYRIRDLQGHEHSAYRITWEDTNGQPGAWYGIEGMDWTNPPLFQDADVRYYGGRRYELVGNGRRIQDIGWIAGGVLYWVSNTIFGDLTNAQMIALAQSSQPVTQSG
jgi:polyisoprenyl-teichoic acid--peptidoglycan teichoic acid transferase